MLVVNGDGSIVTSESRLPALHLQRGYTELIAQPGAEIGECIEQLLALAFDGLNLDVFEMRVREERRV